MRPPVPGSGAGYALIAWSELGMHCIDGKDYSVFSVLPPYNIIHAQLVQKTEPPTIITTGVTIRNFCCAAVERGFCSKIRKTHRRQHDGPIIGQDNCTA
jgi:hypothetical protein